MTTVELPSGPRLAPTHRTTHILDFMSRSETSRLPPLVCTAVIARNTSMTATLWLADGKRRFTRERYCSVGDMLYVAPTRVWARSFDLPLFIEADISEVDGLRVWRYVKLTGTATLLQPTGAQSERRQWADGIEALQKAIELPDIQQLQFANAGILRVEDLDVEGSMAQLGFDNILLPEIVLE